MTEVLLVVFVMGPLFAICLFIVHVQRHLGEAWKDFRIEAALEKAVLNDYTLSQGDWCLYRRRPSRGRPEEFVLFSYRSHDEEQKFAAAGPAVATFVSLVEQ